MTRSWTASIPRLKPRMLETIVNGSNPNPASVACARQAVHQPKAAGDQDFPAPERRWDQGVDG